MVRIHRYMRAITCECVILVILHISYMLLYLHLKQILYNIKMKSKIHANNLKF